MPPQELSGKVALVTGGALRVGRSICRELASAGASIALTYRNSDAEARSLASELEQMGVRALAVPCDVRQEDAVTHAVTHVAEVLGRIDIVVNNAAVFEAAELATLETAAWDRVFETNTRGPFLVARTALPIEGDHDKGVMELKTNEEGKCVIDVIPIGDTVRMQVIARGFQTSGEDFKVDKEDLKLTVRLRRPGEQFSIYKSHSGAQHTESAPAPEKQATPPATK